MAKAEISQFNLKKWNMRKIITTLLITCLCIACGDEDKEINDKIQNGLNTAYNNPPKLDIFKDVEGLKNAITANNKTDFNLWRLSKFIDGRKLWRSNTAIEQFGKYSTKNFQQNYVSYTLYGLDESFVNQVDLTLNIKNPEEKDNALFRLSTLGEDLLGKLHIKTPKGMAEKIQNDAPFFIENDSLFIFVKKSGRHEQNYAKSNIPELQPADDIYVDIRYLVVKSK